MEYKTRVFYTSCPEDYDGFGTRTTEVAGYDGKGRAVRRVLIDPDHYDWQLNRYWSGGIYLTADTDEWLKLLGYGLVTEENPLSSEHDGPVHGYDY